MKPPEIKIPTQANTEYIKEGDVKELQCQAEGNPTPTYVLHTVNDFHLEMLFFIA